MAATVIFSFFLYDFISAYESNRDLRLLVQLRSFVKAVWGVFRSSWILYLVLLLFFGFLVYYYIFMKSATPRVTAGGVTWYGGSILLNYLTIPKIIIYYIKQIVWPADLLVDYKFFPIIPQNPYEIEVILSLGAVAGILLGAFFLLQYNKIALFGCPDLYPK